MVKIVLLASFLGLVATTTANGGVCTRPPYARMLPLSGFPPAEAYCSAKVTLTQCISTSTASVTSTVSKTVDTATVITSTEIRTVVLETSTLTSTTATITVIPKIGSTSTVTTTTGTTTVTIHSTTSAACTTAPRQDSGRNLKRQPNKGHLLAYLKAQPLSYISTACSCIETPIPCITKTSTTTIIATASITATASIVTTSRKFITVTVTVFTKTITTESPQLVTTTISVEATSTTTVTTTTTTGCTPTQPLAGCTSGVIVSTGANGCSFNNFCDMIADFPGSGDVTDPATTLMDCINACSADSSCNAYIFDGNAITCTLVETSQFFQVANPRSDIGVAYGTIVSDSCDG